MSDDPNDRAAHQRYVDTVLNPEQELLARKARRFRMPQQHVPLPAHQEPYAPAPFKRPITDSPKRREIIMSSLLLAAEAAGWPEADLGKLGGAYAHNSKHAGIKLSSEQDYRQFAAEAPLGEGPRLATLLTNAPSLFGPPTKTTTPSPEKRGRKSTEDDDERFLDALKGSV